jgi:hypothetical protein
MPVEGVCTTRNTPPTQALRARWLVCKEGGAGKQAGPTSLLPALLYGRTPTFTSRALYATARADFVLLSTICTGAFKTL